MTESSKNVYSPTANAAYVLMVIATVLTSWMIITMAWTIPITLATKRLVNSYKPAPLLGVCCILFTFFLGAIAGILIICNNENSYQEIKYITPNVNGKTTQKVEANA
ncbi:hypothetical protein SLITO_v1c05200 [Spiroplasma litorale]|uniref:Uncharacterized protein n=1 Tax=Spiroplasma litorale TaxID=216942 RepID=A0A0K1W1W2_9MOLU|nr:hypothetical protein [Spiroplasma litorale]AKX34168.1 hypothetical protein SLITO_v1c05200 [Spiroplasma litorale]